VEFIGTSLDHYYDMKEPTKTDLIADYAINDPLLPLDTPNPKYTEASASVLYMSRTIRQENELEIPLPQGDYGKFADKVKLKELIT